MAEKSETLVTKEEKINEAKELFGRGSRNYCMKQYADAADDLSACCSIYSELYGPNAVECGLPYLMYAKSLIAIGKDENNLIVPGDDEEEADDDDDDDDEENGEEEGADGDEKEEHEEKQDEDEEMDTKESSTDAKDSTVAEKENGIEEKKEESDPSKVEVATEAAAGSSSSDAKAVATNGEPTPGPSTSNGDTSVQEETPDNLQVAWEILELAVHIFQEQGEKGYENLPECYVELAGISFENSFFKDAINDYGKALEIYKKTNQSDQRLLAEVNYKVGLCHMMEREFEESIISFKGAITELDKVVETEKAKEQTDDTKEIIEDIEQLKKEILDKITDVEEAMKTPIEDVKRELSKIIVSGGGESSSKDLNNGASSSSSGATNGSAAKSSSAATKPANDISHLIKRKKPDSATTEVEGSPAKKTASE